MPREYLAIGAMAAVLVFSNLLAILLAAPFLAALPNGAFGNPQAISNVAIYLLIVLGFTAAVLFIVKVRRQNWVKYIILGSMAFTIWFVFSLPLYLGLSTFLDVDLASNLASIIALVLALGLAYALYKYPEWYVVDAAGLSVSAGVTAIIGISFGILPALILLAALAIYDAIAVYKTKHMVTLADAVSGLRLPVLLVIPRRRGYSFLKQPGLKDQLAKGEEREAMFMGLGDIIVPGILVVSSFAYLQPPYFPAGDFTRALGVALVTLAGAVVGFTVLMRFVMRGNPQAGLPLLNGGAIVGYTLSYLVLFRNLTFGVGL